MLITWKERDRDPGMGGIEDGTAFGAYVQTITQLYLALAALFPSQYNFSLGSTPFPIGS